MVDGMGLLTSSGEDRTVKIQLSGLVFATQGKGYLMNASALGQGSLSACKWSVADSGQLLINSPCLSLGHW